MVQIVDHRGEPLRQSDLTREISGPTVTGTRSIWTSLTRDITPARLASILRESEQPGEGAAARYVELAEVMEERDLHYLGVVSTRKRQVAQIGIVVEPVSDAAEDVRDADLVREWFERDELEDEIVDILDAIAKGYSVGEIIWETSEREWRPVRIEHRLPQWFDFDRVTGTQLQVRGDEGGWVDLAPYKFVTHVPRAKSGLPIRGGLARTATFAWIAKTYTLRDWVQFSEVYGRPFRLGKYHKNATENEKSILYRAVRDLGADAAAIIPEEMLIEFMGDKSGTAHSDMHRELLRYVDSQLSIAVLGQTLTTQEGDSGSYSLGQVHNQVREDIERSDGRQLAATIRRDMVVPIVTLNHGPRSAYPKVVIERESQPDLELLSKSLERLVPLGLRVRQEQIRTMFGLEEPDDDDEVLESRSPPPMAPPGATDPPPAPPARARDAGGDHPRALAATLMEDDPVPALTARTRDAVGPLIDDWATRIRSGDLREARSLEGFRDRLEAQQAWVDDPDAPMPDVDDVVAALGPALAAAELAGHFDVDEDPVGVDADDVARAADATALCTASAEHTQLPFSEQIEFFRSKLDLPTEAWTDIWHMQHDVAFVVAGAAHDDLVGDLRGAVDQAIAEGTTLATFRRDFDGIVAEHGWSYKGGRAWRTEVIYGTNLRTSYAAGRYRQMKTLADRRPWWRYRHSHASEHPRSEHLAWDGIVLRHDDPWWKTHYGPNGWGCKCYVEALGERDLVRLGKTGPDTAPPMNMRTVTVGKTSPNPRTVSVPEGIDPGWAYAPGRLSVDGGYETRERVRRVLPVGAGEGAPPAPPLDADARRERRNARARRARYQARLRQDMGEAWDRFHTWAETAATGTDVSALTEPEHVATYLYTTSNQDWGFAPLNQALRQAAAGREPLPPRLRRYRDTLADALTKLPDYRGWTRRGVQRLTDEQLAVYRQGEIVPEPAFLSTSIDNPFEGAVIFSVRSRHGKHIAPFSQAKQESEVLFNANTRFRVLERFTPDDAPGVTYITLEETP